MIKLVVPIAKLIMTYLRIIIGQPVETPPKHIGNVASQLHVVQLPLIIQIFHRGNEINEIIKLKLLFLVGLAHDLIFFQQINLINSVLAGFLRQNIDFGLDLLHASGWSHFLSSAPQLLALLTSFHFSFTLRLQFFSEIFFLFVLLSP